MGKLMCDRCEREIDYIYAFPGKLYIVRCLWGACYVTVGFLFGLIVG